MNTIVLDSSGSNVIADDSRESMMAEMEKTLRPLPADILKQLDDMGKFRRYDLTAAEPADLALNAKSNTLKDTSAFLTFTMDWMNEAISSRTPNIKDKYDNHGRRFFSFDNDINNSVVVVVFDVSGCKMVNVKDVILPLDEFFSLEACCKRPFENTDKAYTRELISDHVFCRFKHGSYRFDIDINMFAMILSHLSNIYKAPASNTVAPIKSALLPPVVVFEPKLPKRSWFSRCFRTRA